MASRSLSDLLPHVEKVVKEWIAACAGRGVELLVYCTYRTPEEQDALYAIGRSLPGKKVTMAQGWKSWHNYRRAVDAVPLVGGKPLWRYSQDDANWRVAVEEAEVRGMEWAGRWQTFREYVHFQLTEGLSLVAARERM